MKQHANHGRDHVRQGMDPAPFMPGFEILLSPDLHTPFTAYATDPYTDAVVSFFVPPAFGEVQAGGLYLREAQAFVDTPSDAGDVLVGIYNYGQSLLPYALSPDGSAVGYLTVAEGDRVGSLASADAILTTMLFQPGERVWIYCQQTDAVAQGLKVWVEFAESSVPGANAPAPD